MHKQKLCLYKQPVYTFKICYQLFDILLEVRNPESDLTMKLQQRQHDGTQMTDKNLKKKEILEFKILT